jgi:C4-dicarboxylate-specific signal transduction histidine kinase
MHSPAEDATPLSPAAIDRIVTLGRAHTIQSLLRGIAHDIRNNLQVLALSSGMGAFEADATVLSRVDGAVEAMTATLDLLGQLGRYPTDPDPVSDLGEVLRTVERLAEFQRNVPQTAARIDPVTRPIPVAISAPALTQVLLDLLHNAKEASGLDGSDVQVMSSEGSAGMTIVIADRGPGPGHVVERPLAGDWPTDSHGGVGVFVARTLVERAGGTLEFRARAGGGTETVVTLRPAP